MATASPDTSANAAAVSAARGEIREIPHTAFEIWTPTISRMCAAGAHRMLTCVKREAGALPV
jgi:hypothetical protein